MIVKIENPAYSYGNAIVTVSAEVNIYADDGTTLMHQRAISASGNTQDADLREILQSKLTGQAQEIKDTFVSVMASVQQFYPEVSSPQEALGMLIANVQGGLV